jgi:hypothetical protein
MPPYQAVAFGIVYLLAGLVSLSLAVTLGNWADGALAAVCMLAFSAWVARARRERRRIGRHEE